jgi:IS4 transposase
MHLSASSIAAIYKERWQIELSTAKPNSLGCSLSELDRTGIRHLDTRVL